MARWIPAGVALLAVMASLPAAGQQQEAEEEKQGRRRFRFTFTKKEKRPSIRWSRIIRADFRVKFQTDFRTFDPEDRNDEALFDFNRRRVGVQGVFLRHFEFEVERDLPSIELGPPPPVSEIPEPERTPWRDVFVNFRYLRRFQIQGGYFKVPFSYDQLTGPNNLDFVYRSRLADLLAPGRDLGLVAHGRLWNRLVNYELGIFREDGERARADNIGTGERTFAGRLTGSPLRLIHAPPILKDLHVGVAVASSNVIAGVDPPKGFRGRTPAREQFFERFFVNGNRRRIGTELAWLPGPFGIKGEYVTVSDQRLGQGLRSNDLPNLLSRGWYLSGTWCLTGESKGSGIEPKREFITGGGIGAVEIAGRFEALRFGSAAHEGRPSRGTRAANILGNSDRIWTFGVNWFVNRWSKIQYNAVRDKIEDTQAFRAPIRGRSTYWMHAVRLQFVL